jgi:hypothetical protein
LDRLVVFFQNAGIEFESSQSGAQSGGSAEVQGGQGWKRSLKFNENWNNFARMLDTVPSEYAQMRGQHISPGGFLAALTSKWFEDALQRTISSSQLPPASQDGNVNGIIEQSGDVQVGVAGAASYG